MQKDYNYKLIKIKYTFIDKAIPMVVLAIFIFHQLLLITNNGLQQNIISKQ